MDSWILRVFPLFFSYLTKGRLPIASCVISGCGVRNFLQKRPKKSHLRCWKPTQKKVGGNFMIADDRDWAVLSDECPWYFVTGSFHPFFLSRLDTSRINR